MNYLNYIDLQRTLIEWQYYPEKSGIRDSMFRFLPSCKCARCINVCKRSWSSLFSAARTFVSLFYMENKCRYLKIQLLNECIRHQRNRMSWIHINYVCIHSYVDVAYTRRSKQGHAYIHLFNHTQPRSFLSF